MKWYVLTRNDTSPDPTYDGAQCQTMQDAWTLFKTVMHAPGVLNAWIECAPDDPEPEEP